MPRPLNSDPPRNTVHSIRLLLTRVVVSSSQRGKKTRRRQNEKKKKIATKNERWKNGTSRENTIQSEQRYAILYTSSVGIGGEILSLLFFSLRQQKRNANRFPFPFVLIIDREGRNVDIRSVRSRCDVSALCANDTLVFRLRALPSNRIGYPPITFHPRQEKSRRWTTPQSPPRSGSTGNHFEGECSNDSRTGLPGLRIYR